MHLRRLAQGTVPLAAESLGISRQRQGRHGRFWNWWIVGITGRVTSTGTAWTKKGRGGKKPLDQSPDAD